METLQITCSDTQTIHTGSPISICGHLVQIYDIKPLFATIDVLVDGQMIPGVGTVDIALDSVRVLITLISKNVSAGTAVVTFATEPNIPPPTPERDYTVQLQLSSNPFFSLIEQSIFSISDQIAQHLPSINPNIQYVNTEFSNGLFSVNLKYVGPYTLTMYSLQLPTLDDIKNQISDWVELYLIPAILIIIGLIIAASILSGGITLTAVAEVATVLGALFFSAYVIYDKTAQIIAAKINTKNNNGKVQADNDNSTAKKALDDAYAKCIQQGGTGTDLLTCCVNLLTGYQKVDIAWVNKIVTNSPCTGDVSSAIGTYNSCTNSLINNLKTGSITCDQARANFSPCVDTLHSSIDTLFSNNCDPNAPVNKPKDNTGLYILLGLGIFGFMMLGGKKEEVIVR